METKTLIPPGLKQAFDGVIPFVIGTSSLTGNPNITFMSRLFCVDDTHVALSHQFMNKTWKNLKENPFFVAFVTHPETFGMWKLHLEYIEEKKEGFVFEEMEMELLALSTPQNITFSLQSALICKVLRVEEVFKGI